MLSTVQRPNPSVKAAPAYDLRWTLGVMIKDSPPINESQALARDQLALNERLKAVGPSRKPLPLTCNTQGFEHARRSETISKTLAVSIQLLI